MKFVCEKCAHEIGGMPPYERFKAFCPNCKKLAWFTPKKLNQSTARRAKEQTMCEETKNNEKKNVSGFDKFLEAITGKRELTPSEKIVKLARERDTVYDRLNANKDSLEKLKESDAEEADFLKKQVEMLEEQKKLLGDRIKKLVDET